MFRESWSMRSEGEEKFTECSRHRHREKHVQKFRGNKELGTDETLKGHQCSGSMGEGRLWFKMRLRR